MQAKTEITIEAGDWSSHIGRPSQLVTFTGKSQSMWMRGPLLDCRSQIFLDALASLDLKLSVSEWVSNLPFFND